MEPTTIIDLEQFYIDQAKLDDIEKYKNKAIELAGKGQIIIITGRAPVWLYLVVAHALHGKAKKLIYDSPVTGQVEIFNHDPFKY